VSGLRGLLLAFCLSLAGSAAAADAVLLIQQGPEGFRVWHNAGASVLPDDDVLEIMMTARPAGGEVVPTPLGPAQAFEQAVGIVIRLPEAPSDKALLVDRDACGHVHLWHAEGKTRLPDDVLFEIVHSAKPDGGPRLRFGDLYVKAFHTKLGITATLWSVPKK
jgi:hypothetical protein